MGENVQETNRFYGGLELPVSRVVIINGGLDPWRRAGPADVLPNAYGDYEVITVEGACGFSSIMTSLTVILHQK